MLEEFIVENLLNWVKEGNAPPVQVSFSPTDLCNLKCQSCWRHSRANTEKFDHKKEGLSEKQMLGIIREAKSLGAKCIELTGGGEPLIREDIETIVSEIKALGMIGWMTSNGTLFKRELIKKMVEQGWDKLTISLDGPNEQINDILRPPSGSFAKVLKTLAFFAYYKKILNKDTPQLTINTVISRHNIGSLRDFMPLAQRFGIQMVTFEPLQILSDKCYALALDKTNEHDLIIDEMRKAQDAAISHNIGTNLDTVISNFSPERKTDALNASVSRRTLQRHALLNSICFEPWFHVYIQMDGWVRPCCASNEIGENIKEKSLKEIWEGKSFGGFRNAIISATPPELCKKCSTNLQFFTEEIRRSYQKRYKCNSDNLNHKKIRLLVTDTAPLYPPRWGGPRRIWSLFGSLSPHLFDIAYVGVNPSRQQLSYSFKKIQDNFREVLCVLPPHYYLWHIIEKKLFNNTSLDLFIYLLMHTDRQFTYVVNAYDANVVICSHPWSSRAIKKKPHQRFIYDAHNCEYLLMKQILKDHPLKQIVLREVRKIESDACKKSDLVVACSENERKDLMDLYRLSSDKIIVIPNGTYIRKKATPEEKSEARNKLSILQEEKLIVFVGAYYKPNNDAASVIVEQIAPRLAAMRFLIVGSVADAFAGQVLPPNVTFLGKVTEEQLVWALNAADIAINPMQEGSGSNIKMLDYMSSGLPIVTTECGSRGIETNGAKPMRIVLLEEFVPAIKQLITQPDKCMDMSEAGRYLAAQHYDWDMLSRMFEEAIIKIIT